MSEKKQKKTAKTKDILRKQTTTTRSSAKSDVALREEAVLEFWKKKHIFEKTLKKEAPKGEFVFYEGPPTANGRPGIHHIEARAFKDAIPRYKTMRGYHVRRKGGWDTHGLPVELQVEKALGLTSKKDIEKYGIAEFNKKCKESVWEYVEEWQSFTDRVGYWVDIDNPYVTYDPNYIESVWSVVQRIYEQDLLYKDYKVVPWCPRCGTALSSHELAQGYVDVKDLAVTVKFHLVAGQDFGSGNKIDKNTYVLAWTTTPWTLPGNVGLAVGTDIHYSSIRVKGAPELFIVASELVKILFSDKEIEVVNGDIKGDDLVGLEYEPLYPFLNDLVSKEQKNNIANAYKIYAGDFVTIEDGTGIVHTAVMYGQEDFELGTKVGLPKHHLVDESGHFILGTGFLERSFVKDIDTDIAIIKDLSQRKLLFKKEKYEHNYPHCWRCKTALIYYARDSWYIKMSKLRDKLVKENSSIHWIPDHIKDGRFGEWVREVKDWAISRERYWGTPLPVWINSKTGAPRVIGSVEELKSYSKSSGNKYHIMRHGEAVYNTKNTLNADTSVHNPLTEKGKEVATMTAEKLKKEEIDIIIHSPLQRTKETAQIVAETIGFDTKELIEDDRLREITFGEFEGKKIEDYHSYFEYSHNRMNKYPKGGETWTEVKKRVGELVHELEQKFTGKTILIVSHNGPLQMLQAAVGGYDVNKCAECIEKDLLNVKTGERRKLSFVPLPHNEDYELDLHRPYIDELSLVDTDRSNLVRVKEVIDVWFDSGAMPFAQDHYPMENKKWVEGSGYPADFISEAIDQTRGWFYTLHAVGVLMGRGKAYKNVISLGHILDSEGKKMSKSIGNVIDPWEMIHKYGVDVLRFWMYTVNQPGDSKNFDERTVDEITKKVSNLLLNVVKFYELYDDKTSAPDGAVPNSAHVLDKWIVAQLHSLITMSTKQLDNYDVLTPARGIREFIGKLSTWYIRRSRERFKGNDIADKEAALQTVQYVLQTLCKLLAPLMPFIADEVYKRTFGTKESVHLEEWPKTDKKHKDDELICDMEVVRSVVTLALEAREKAGLRVRQPLQKVILKDTTLEKKTDLLKLIEEEVNVKEVAFDDSLSDEVVLDTNITDELKEEGSVREIMRHIQDMRKKANLSPHDSVGISIRTDKTGEALIIKYQKHIQTTTNINNVIFESTNEGESIAVDSKEFSFALKV